MRRNGLENRKRQTFKIASRCFEFSTRYHFCGKSATHFDRHPENPLEIWGRRNLRARFPVSQRNWCHVPGLPVLCSQIALAIESSTWESYTDGNAEGIRRFLRGGKRKLSHVQSTARLNAKFGSSIAVVLTKRRVGIGTIEKPLCREELT